jgi:hypothetical protein
MLFETLLKSFSHSAKKNKMIIRKLYHSEETHVNSIVSENVEVPRSEFGMV